MEGLLHHVSRTRMLCRSSRRSNKQVTVPILLTKHTLSHHKLFSPRTQRVVVDARLCRREYYEAIFGKDEGLLTLGSRCFNLELLRKLIDRDEARDTDRCVTDATFDEALDVLENVCTRTKNGSKANCDHRKPSTT